MLCALTLVSAEEYEFEKSSPVVYATFFNEHSLWKGRACLSLRSAMMQGIRVTVLGQGSHTFRHLVRGTGPATAEGYDVTLKVRAMLEFVRQLDNRTIVFFNDGSDVLYTRGAVQAQQVFEAEETRDAVLFSAERTCSPVAFLPDLYPEGTTTSCRDEALNSGSSFKYLNSGGWAARAGTAQDLLIAWVDALAMQPEGSHPAGSDQAVAHMLYHRDTPFTMTIDHGCTVWQTTYATALHDAASLGEADPSGPWVRPDGSVYNSETRTSPLFVHFNGGRFGEGFQKAEAYVQERMTRAGEVDYITVTLPFYRAMYGQLTEKCADWWH